MMKFIASFLLLSNLVHAQDNDQLQEQNTITSQSQIHQFPNVENFVVVGDEQKQKLSTQETVSNYLEAKSEELNLKAQAEIIRAEHRIEKETQRTKEKTSKAEKKLKKLIKKFK
jgi:hypothetical protein